MDRPEGLKAPLDDAGLEEISFMLSELFPENDSVSRPQTLDPDGSSSKVIMEQEDMEQDTQIGQITTIKAKIGRIEKKICSLEVESKKSSERNLEIEKLQSLLKSEQEEKTEMKAHIKGLHKTIKKMYDVVESLNKRTAVTEESINVINKDKEDGSTREACKLDETIKKLTKQIEDRITNGMENYKRLINDIQREQKSAKDSSEIMDTKIYNLQKKSVKNSSEITSLQSLLASERESRTKVEGKLKFVNADIQKAVETLTTRTTVTEESIKVINKEKEDGSAREACKLDEAIKALTKQIEDKFTNEMGSLINDIQTVKESVERSDKQIESNFKVCRAGATKTVRTIKVAMEELEKQMQSENSETQVTVTETVTASNPSVVTNQIQQQSELRPGSNTTVSHAVDNAKRNGVRVYCLCGKNFSSKSSRQTHILSQTCTESDKKFHCSLCLKRFLTKGELNAHRKKVHKLARTGGIGCRLCGRICRNSLEHYQHRRSCKSGEGKKVQKTKTSKRRITRSRPPKRSTGKAIIHGKHPTQSKRCLCGKRFEFECRLKRHIKHFHKDDLSESTTGTEDVRQNTTLAPPPPLDLAPEGSAEEDPSSPGGYEMLHSVPRLGGCAPSPLNYNSPMTPREAGAGRGPSSADVYGYPQTPGAGLDPYSTLGSPSITSATSMPGPSRHLTSASSTPHHNHPYATGWHTTGIEVTIKESHPELGLRGQNGVIRNVLVGNCTVFLVQEKKTVNVPSDQLIPTLPETGDRVKVIAGELREGVGYLKSVDGGDCFVESSFR